MFGRGCGYWPYRRWRPAQKAPPYSCLAPVKRSARALPEEQGFSSWHGSSVPSGSGLWLHTQWQISLFWKRWATIPQPVNEKFQPFQLSMPVTPSIYTDCWANSLDQDSDSSCYDLDCATGQFCDLQEYGQLSWVSVSSSARFVVFLLWNSLWSLTSNHKYLHILNLWRKKWLG